MTGLIPRIRALGVSGSARSTRLELGPTKVI